MQAGEPAAAHQEAGQREQEDEPENPERREDQVRNEPGDREPGGGRRSRVERMGRDAGNPEPRGKQHADRAQDQAERRAHDRPDEQVPTHERIAPAPRDGPGPRDQHLRPAAASERLERDVDDPEPRSHSHGVGEAHDEDPTLVGRGDMVRAQDPHRRLEKDDRRADSNRSPLVAPARAQVVAGDEGSPNEEEEQQPFEYEGSGLLGGLALRIPARPGPGPDPAEAHRPAAIGSGLDAHRDAGMLGMRTLPGGADARVVARSPARIHRSEAVQIQAGLAKEEPQSVSAGGRRIPLALGRDDGEHPEPATRIQRDLGHARLQRGRCVLSHLRQRKRPAIRGTASAEAEPADSRRRRRRARGPRRDGGSPRPNGESRRR